jgi:hypothetical protein
MLKKEDDGDDEVDDEVRTTVSSQNHKTAILSNEKSFLWTSYLYFSPYINKSCGGGDRK